MIKTVDIGEIYKISLFKEYWTDLEFMVRIGGITRKSSTEIFSDYSVKDELFTKYEHGLLTYLELYPDDVDVYICNKVVGVSPLSIDFDNSIFIPKLVIDMERSEKMLETYDIGVTLSNLNVYLDDTDESYADFAKRIKTEVKSKLQYHSLFCDESMTITINTTSKYKKESDICRHRDINEAIYKKYEDVINQQKYDLEKQRNQLTQSIIANNASKDEYTRKYSELGSKLEAVERQTTANDQLYSELIGVKNMLDSIINNKLKPAGDLVGVDIKSLQEYIDEYNENNNDGD